MREIPEVKLLCRTFIVAIVQIIAKLTSIDIILIYSPTSNMQGCLITPTPQIVYYQPF